MLPLLFMGVPTAYGYPMDDIDKMWNAYHMCKIIENHGSQFHVQQIVMDFIDIHITKKWNGSPTLKDKCDVS